MFSTTLSIIIPDDLIDIYKLNVEKHNKEVHTNPYADSGFDLFMPKDIKINPGEVEFISHDVKCKMNDGSGFYVYPRSSISKTPLMMANHVGIIDSGYRDTIKIRFKYIPQPENYTILDGKHMLLAIDNSKNESKLRSSYHCKPRRS